MTIIRTLPILALLSLLSASQAFALYSCQYYQSAGICPANWGTANYSLCQKVCAPAPPPAPIDHLFNPYISLNHCDTDARTLGAKGDGATNDTLALQSAVNQTPSGGTLCISDGTYLIDAVKGLVLKSGFRLKLTQNAVLKAIANNAQSYGVLKLYDLNDVVIDGGNIQGERSSHLGTLGEWGMGIDIRGGSKITVRNIKISNCWGDGIYVGRGYQTLFPTNIDLFDIVSDQNRRQGLSLITGQNVAIIRATLKNTSGTPPSAGLDIEPNQSDEPLANIQIQDLSTQNNFGPGISIYLGQLNGATPVNISIARHTDVDSSYGLNFYALMTSGILTINQANWLNSDLPFSSQRSCGFKLSVSAVTPSLSPQILNSCK